jgi:hypothetical protein
MDGPGVVLGIAAQIMRDILVAYARKRIAKERGGGQRLINLGDAFELSHGNPGNLTVRTIELRFLSELTVDETTEIPCDPSVTVKASNGELPRMVATGN